MNAGIFVKFPNEFSIQFVWYMPLTLCRPLFLYPISSTLSYLYYIFLFLSYNWMKHL